MEYKSNCSQIKISILSYFLSPIQILIKDSFNLVIMISASILLCVIFSAYCLRPDKNDISLECMIKRHLITILVHAKLCQLKLQQNQPQLIMQLRWFHYIMCPIVICFVVWNNIQSYSIKVFFCILYLLLCILNTLNIGNPSQ